MEEYVYDGDGKRIKKIDADSERIYIYSGWNVLYEVNTTTQMDAIYLYGPTGKIAKKVNDIMEYYHTDHLGSTRLVTSENGTVTEEIQYEPFGEQIDASEEKYTYNGKERDETGLYHYGARYYDSAIGRFISRDPLTGKKESPQTLNRYTYCLNNPLTYVDPAGTEAEPLDPQETAEKVFGRLQNIDPNALAQVQALLDAGKQFEALCKILELLGFVFEDKGDGTLSVEIGRESYTISIDNDLGDWGLTNNRSKTISINFSSGKVGDITLTVLHEVCHALLGSPSNKDEDTAQHQPIYNVEYSYFVALRWIGVEFSSGDITKHEKNFVRHMSDMVFWGYGFNEEFQVPLSEILRRWIPGSVPC